jgi:hypothetical protein
MLHMLFNFKKYHYGILENCLIFGNFRQEVCSFPKMYYHHLYKTIIFDFSITFDHSTARLIKKNYVYIKIYEL